MSPATIFQIHLVLGYVPWLLCFGAYVWPRLKAMDRVEAQRAIATLHSFRFFGLVFMIPASVGPNLPTGFATFAAYGDFATGLLAMPGALSRYGYVRSFGRSSSPSISWGRPTSSSTIITARSRRRWGYGTQPRRRVGLTPWYVRRTGHRPEDRHASSIPSTLSASHTFAG